MLILYTQHNCPFSARVIKAGEEMGLTFEVRDIGEQAYEQELIEKGGKRETPYFIDTEANVEMYESDKIISYLIEKEIA